MPRINPLFYVYFVLGQNVQRLFAAMYFFCDVNLGLLALRCQSVGPDFTQPRLSAAGVVVSCKIPILATRVRFPGGALRFS